MNVRRLRIARLVAAAGLLAVTIGAVAPAPSGVALGPVVAITPHELSGSSGQAEDPVLSGRGETAGVYDGEITVNGWALFDVPGAEAMFDGEGVTVSGNGCALLWAARPQFPDTVFTLSDRCRGIEREVYRTPFPYGNNSIIALSHTGRFGVIVVPTDSQGAAQAVLRVDTETLALAQMPLPGGYTNFAGQMGVDISDDGNVIAATAFGFATAVLVQQPPFVDVAVWDVPSGSVNVVSNASVRPGAAFPSLSGDGRYVSFAAAKPLAGGESGSGPWVYVVDRANGAIRRVSAGNEHSYHSSITRDGSQVAFTVGAAACTFDPFTLADVEFNCPGTRVDVAFGPSPGFASPFSTETISLAPNGAPAPGRHFSPALSGNGRWVAWISNSAAALGITDTSIFGFNAFMRRRDPGLVVDPIDFGTIAANTTSTLPATVRNTGRTSVSLDAITATPGQFTIQGGGTCAGGSSLPPGATCTVNVRYAAPNNTSTTTGSITVAEAGYDPISAVGRLIGRSSFTPPPTTTTTTIPTPGPTTTVGQIPPGRTTTTTSTTTTTTPGQVELTADPNPVDFGQVAVGLGSPIQTVTITNIGTGSGQMLTELTGANPEDFFVVSNGCNELVLAPSQSCTMQIMMIPLAGGRREAALTLSAGGVSGDVGLTGVGHLAPQLLATPAAITTSQFTTIIGRGFPPNQSFDVHIDPTGLVITVTSDAQGQFRIPISPLGKLTLGNYILRVDPLPDVFDLVRGQLVVVLATFEPQGPGGAAFGEALIVTRGG
ncbi:MAG TPA: choice-of-anchor D domain-containing protein [Ilumatobacter sp.]|nr:choice-of-anchor D domain-containing protein [Ilumatobacter sp.]